MEGAGEGKGSGVKRQCSGQVVPVQLASALCEDGIAEKLRDAWESNSQVELDGIHLFNAPFQLGKISNVLEKSNVIEGLVQEMAEEVAWTRRQTDFLELNQSCDLISIPSPKLSEFYEFLKTDMMAWMRKVTGMELSHVSANCSMYNHGDHLLVHDDCIADRKIAFVFYLSPWKGTGKWTEEMGGALELFDLRAGQTEPNFPVTKRIPPENNQMVFFRVCNKSFHQVGEVLTRDYPRLTINGWFHGPGDVFEAQVRENPLIGRLKRPNEIEIELSEWINETYLKDHVIASVEAEIEEESQMSLREFLIPDFVELIVRELFTGGPLKWDRSYSACERNYESLVWDSATGPLKDLRNLFESPAVFDLLHKYTSLDLSGEHAREPKCFVELQRWTNECYTMLVNESRESYLGNVLEIILYLNEACGGVATFVYVNQGNEEEEKDGEDEDSQSENDDVLLTVEPQANSLNMVYCTDGTTRFGKYVSKAVDMTKNKFVYLLSCTFKE